MRHARFGAGAVSYGTAVIQVDRQGEDDSGVPAFGNQEV